MALETTLILVKPDGVSRGLVGEVVSRIERKGFRLAGMKLMHMSDDLAAKHYAEHVEKPFYPALKAFMTGGPLVAMAVQGEDAVAQMRTLMGATNPANATPGTLRGDFCTETTKNLVHGSDSPASAERELALWFAEGELVD